MASRIDQGHGHGLPYTLGPEAPTWPLETSELEALMAFRTHHGLLYNSGLKALMDSMQLGGPGGLHYSYRYRARGPDDLHGT